MFVTIWLLMYDIPPQFVINTDVRKTWNIKVAICVLSIINSLLDSLVTTKSCAVLCHKELSGIFGLSCRVFWWLPLLWSLSFLYRESMNLLHFFFKCSIHHTVPLQQSLPFELFRHNLDFITRTATAKRDYSLSQIIKDEWYWQNLYLPSRYVNDFLIYTKTNNVSKESQIIKQCYREHALVDRKGT